MRNLLFYKYVEIDNPKLLKEEHLKLLLSLNLKGKVILSTEGINGCVTGDETEQYKKLLTKDPRFADIEFKDTEAPEHGFNRTLVKVKKEIVASKTLVSVHNKAPYIEPLELKKKLDEKQEIYLLDARNTYESSLGKFRGAITPEMKAFNQFQSAVKDLAHLKHKTIVTYCTGGIRCEKASAILKENGFTDVQQLHGGIIKYGEVVGSDHWEGVCFVFDKRGGIAFDPMAPKLTQCSTCSTPASQEYICKRCSKTVIGCAGCIVRLAGCCSKSCRNKKK